MRPGRRPTRPEPSPGRAGTNSRLRTHPRVAFLRGFRGPGRSSIMGEVPNIVDAAGRNVWALYWRGGRIIMPRRGTMALVVASSPEAAVATATRALDWVHPNAWCRRATRPPGSFCPVGSLGSFAVSQWCGRAIREPPWREPAARRPRGMCRSGVGLLCQSSSWSSSLRVASHGAQIGPTILPEKRGMAASGSICPICPRLERLNANLNGQAAGPVRRRNAHRAAGHADVGRNFGRV